MTSIRIIPYFKKNIHEKEKVLDFNKADKQMFIILSQEWVQGSKNLWVLHLLENI
jgi:hypothetical protein